MDEDKPTIKVSFEGFDPLGLKSAGEISKDVVALGIEGVKQFLNLTCKPLLQELGLGLNDTYRNWRLLNTVKMLEKAQGKLRYDFEKEKLVIDPRVAFQIVEHSSIISNESLQEMWAGLFASSCNTYEEDENIFFIDILKRLTSSQVKFLNYLCENCNKTITINSLPAHIEEGNIHTGGLQISYEDVLEIMGTKNKLKADSELNALESMSLIEFQGHVPANTTTSQKIKPTHGAPRLKPSISALLLYVKCQGSNDTPFNYFYSKIIHYYHNRYDAYFSFTEDLVLETLYEASILGEQYNTIIKYTDDNLEITDPSWNKLPDEDLSARLRHFIIFRFLYSIDKEFTVSINHTLIGQFNYIDGFVKS